ncbi:MAG: hypothetical protein GY756_09830 [bacterium]|nr:hypothetical protein [bacterium]
MINICKELKKILEETPKFCEKCGKQLLLEYFGHGDKLIGVGWYCTNDCHILLLHEWFRNLKDI